MKIQKELPSLKNYVHSLHLRSPFAFDRKSFLSFLTFLAGLLCFILGSISMVGWYTDTPVLL